MRLKPISLLAAFFLANVFTPAHACSPPEGALPASISNKAQQSSYVFGGVVTEITDSYIKIKVAQYFKEAELGEVKIAQDKDQKTSCTAHFVLDL